MKSIKVFFANCDVIETQINGTNAEITAYYLNRMFNLGNAAKDDMQRCVAVDIDCKLYSEVA